MSAGVYTIALIRAARKLSTDQINALCDLLDEVTGDLGDAQGRAEDVAELGIYSVAGDFVADIENAAAQVRRVRDTLKPHGMAVILAQLCGMLEGDHWVEGFYQAQGVEVPQLAVVGVVREGSHIFTVEAKRIALWRFSGGSAYLLGRAFTYEHVCEAVNRGDTLATLKVVRVSEVDSRGLVETTEGLGNTPS